MRLENYKVLELVVTWIPPHAKMYLRLLRARKWYNDDECKVTICMSPSILCLQNRNTCCTWTFYLTVIWSSWELCAIHNWSISTPRFHILVSPPLLESTSFALFVQFQIYSTAQSSIVHNQAPSVGHNTLSEKSNLFIP